MCELTTAELTEWAGHGVPAGDAASWYAVLHELCGPPGPDTWGLRPGESPSECALAYALYWIRTFGAADYDDAVRWLPHFPALYGGAELAATWRDAGWGTFDDGMRTVVAAARHAEAGGSPREGELYDVGLRPLQP